MKINDRYDVIVVGGGGAGLCAALAAREKGASVLLLSKSPPGKNNCTAFAAGGFRFAGPGVPWQVHYDETFNTGRQINDTAMLEAFSRYGALAVLNLQRFGMRMSVHSHGARVGQYAPNPTIGGYGMTVPLLKRAVEMGTDWLANYGVDRVHTQGDRVIGISAVDFESGTAYYFSCSSLVIATGGAGRVYGRTNNPLPTTGDGYHLLYNLGLEFRDMEFVQFYPMGLAEQNLPCWFIGLTSIDCAPLTDSGGREFLKELLPEWGLKNGKDANDFARDRSAIAIAKKWAEGEEVFLHMEQLSPEQWEMPLFKDALRRSTPKHDMTCKPVHIKPLVHYISGGVVIDENARTQVDGLFACGEVTGGVDGANRIGGNALTNISLFGLRAGENAALYALSNPVGAMSASPETVAEADADGLYSPVELRTRLQSLMDSHVGPLRSGPKLVAALAGIEELQEKAKRTKISSTKDFKANYELRGMLTTAWLISDAALAREESRGVHYREDFPDENPQWQKTLLQRKKHI
ncbi:MAG: FAD-dependent oxidoreductase [Synergistaceae bacterium]|nr:FAD-dependent oxidoreductase [Synergistaceae bacterium]